MKLKIILAAFTVIFSSIIRAYGEFESESWGARPNALGGAYVGAGEDAVAPFWNPAAIASIYHFESALSYAKPIERLGQKQRDLGSFSAVYGSTGSFGSLGVWWAGESVLDTRRSNTAAVSYGKTAYNWKDRFHLSFGLNLKYMTRSSQTGTRDTRSDLSSDLGMRVMIENRIALGATWRNANRPKVMSPPNERLADQIDIGGAVWLGPDSMLTMDLSGLRNDQRAKPRGGVEQWLFHRVLALRAGGNADHITGGFAVRTGEFRGIKAHLEYAYQHPIDSNEKDKLHVGSIKFTFGEPQQRIVPLAQATPEASAEKIEEVYSDKDFLAKKFGVTTEKHDFPLGPEDIIEIEVKNHPELNVTVIVDAWGNIKLPYVGMLNVRDLTAENIRVNLEKIYADFFVDPPEVVVLVKEYHSRQVLVLGAVQSPGRYPIGGEPVTLRDILLQAGLPSDTAARWRVFIVRQTKDGPIYKHINAYKILYRGDLRNNVELQSGDIIYMPMTLLDALVNYVGRILSPLVGITRTAVSSTLGF